MRCWLEASWLEARPVGWKPCISAIVQLIVQALIESIAKCQALQAARKSCIVQALIEMEDESQVLEPAGKEQIVQVAIIPKQDHEAVQGIHVFLADKMTRMHLLDDNSLLLRGDAYPNERYLRAIRNALAF